MTTVEEGYAAILAELRPGGRPAHVYLNVGAQRWSGYDAAKAAALTTKMMKNYEDRLIALEQKAGMINGS